MRIAPGVNVCYVIHMADDKMRRFEMVLPEGLVEAIDRWRGIQPGIPSRAEAIRSIVGRYLEWPPAPPEDEDERRDREREEQERDASRSSVTGY
jgi:metal-responsive CopG/Arc/MetJ family transcriptional regulator